MTTLFSRTLVGGFALSVFAAAQAETPPFGTMFLEAGSGPTEIEAGDFNGDGIVDLATMQSTTGFPDELAGYSIHLGRGDGTFEPRVSISIGARALYVLVGDFDGDGIDELVAPAPDPGPDDNLYAVYGLNAEGELVVWRTEPLAPDVRGVFSGPRALAGDFNGDGRDDVAIVIQDEQTLDLYFGFPGGFDQALMVLPEGVSGSLSAVIAQDLDGDGSEEIIAAYDESVRVWSCEDGVQVELAALEFEKPIDVLGVGEIDGATGVDLLAGFHGRVGVFLDYAVVGDVLAGTPHGVIALANELLGRELYLFDGNGDGLDDALLLDAVDEFSGGGGGGGGSGADSLHFSAFVQNVSGEFGFPALTQDAPRLGSAPADAAIADFNGDGRPDIAVVNAIRFNGAVTVALGQGAGEFGNVAPGENSTSSALFNARFVDLNADGFVDVISRDDVYFNEQGRFDFESAPGDIGDFGAVGDGRFIDLDGDGDDDQFTFIDGVLTAYINEQGMYTQQPAYELSEQGARYILDFRNGPPVVPGGGESILIAQRPIDAEDPTPYEAIVLSYAAGGAFAEIHASFDLPNVVPFRMSDFNGDGLGDLRWGINEVGADAVDLFVWLNDGAGAFTPDSVPYAQTGPKPGFEEALVDLNGDGLADRVVAQEIEPDAPGRGTPAPDRSLRLEIQQVGGGFVTVQSIVGPGEKGVARSANPSGVLVLDLNGDAVDDLVVAYFLVGPGSGYVWYEGLGDGRFGRANGLVLNEDAVDLMDESIDIADVDLDGDMDVLLGGSVTTSGVLSSSVLASGVLYNRTDGPKASCAGDFNGDGRVGPADLARVVSFWGQSVEIYGIYDLTGDGSIGADDLATLLSAWGDCE